LLALHALLSRDVTALSSASSALRTALDDADAGVVGATINVLCELSRSSASIAAEFISLSPRLLQLLQRSTNNWTLIKLLKLLALLAPHDASLPASLRAPIIKLIKTTNAASLAYEAINTAIAGGLLDGVSDETRELRGLCVHKLEELGKGDANLRFMARRALRQLERRQSGASSDSGRTLEGLLVEFGAEQQSAASESRQSAPRLAATGKQGKEKGALVDLLGDDEEEQQPQEEEKQMQQGPRHLLDLDDAEQIESFNVSLLLACGLLSGHAPHSSGHLLLLTDCSATRRPAAFGQPLLKRDRERGEHKRRRVRGGERTAWKRGPQTTSPNVIPCFCCFGVLAGV
jgi:hypothetical protein